MWPQQRKHIQFPGEGPYRLLPEFLRHEQIIIQDCHRRAQEKGIKSSQNASKKDVSYTKRQFSELTSTPTSLLLVASLRVIVLVKPAVEKRLPSQGVKYIPLEDVPSIAPKIEFQYP